jgi:membrane-bound lytic murein transglycosylase B
MSLSTDGRRRPEVTGRRPRRWWPLAGGLALLATHSGGVPAAERVVDLEGASTFVREMVQRHGLDGKSLEDLLAQAEVLPSVLEAMAKPAEAKPWHEYRRIFVTQERTAGGVQFWRENREALERARARYGVAPEVIVAIIGVETRYGRNTGSYRVLDALGTLAFSPNRRAEMFRRELEQFLLLSREEGISPLEPKGSYAGAMGIPQFIASSYRRYAVDFDDDQRRDLWSNPTDAIGSVANYLRANGWERNGTVAVSAVVTSADVSSLLQAGTKPSLTPARLRAEGVRIAVELPGDTLGALVQLETQDGYEYWVGLQNFYAITRYNHSALYAMAVHQLSEAIKAAYGVPRV